MTALTSAILVIIIIGLSAWIAYLVRRTRLALLLVVLIGALLTHTPGALGAWSTKAATFTLGAPRFIAEFVQGIGS